MNWGPLTSGRPSQTESLTNFDLLFLNLNSPTLVPSCRDPTSPDLTIDSSCMNFDSEWRILTTLSSDHFLITWQFLPNEVPRNLPSHFH